MLNVVEPEKALEIILREIKESDKTEKVNILHALGRINAAPVTARSDVPPFLRSTVDGYAVRAADTYGASEAMPSMLKYKGAVYMGEEVHQIIGAGECCAIPTGGMLPEGSDSVVMSEYTENIGDEFRYIQKSAAILQNVTRKGEDISAGEVIIPSGVLITEAHIGVCASLGITELSVKSPPVIGIISTGDELVEIDKTPLFSQIRDTNTYLLSAFAEKNKCVGKAYPIVHDNKAELERVLLQAVQECDAVLISGGSSVGEKDAVYSVLMKNGTVHFHGLAMKPGKPAMFATVSGKCVFGLPGHPAAAYFVCLRLISPALFALLGQKQSLDCCVTARAESNIPADSGRQELIPVKINGNSTDYSASALYMKSGIISVLSKADGYIIIGRNKEGICKGEEVTIHLL